MWIGLWTLVLFDFPIQSKQNDTLGVTLIKYSDWGHEGYEKIGVKTVEDGGFADQLGLKNGDRLSMKIIKGFSSVNGYHSSHEAYFFSDDLERSNGGLIYDYENGEMHLTVRRRSGYFYLSALKSTDQKTWIFRKSEKID